MPSLVAITAPGGPVFLGALRSAWEEGDAVLPVDPRLPHRALDALLREAAPAFVVDAEGRRRRLAEGRPVEEGDAAVVATSGTTGRPRGVVLTHAALRASAEAASRRLEVDRSADRWLACLPLAHMGGFGVVARALLTGTPLVLHPRFDPSRVEAEARGGATLTALVATALRRVQASLFRTVLLGGGPAPGDRPANAVVTYGLTETAGGVVYDGVPLDGVEVRLSDGGQVQVRGSMLLRAYRDGSDPKDADGWLSTGDVGSLGPDGRLTVEGRLSDLIVTGGENVWPEAVEAALRGHPDVADVAVAGRAHPEWGEEVVAFVVPADRTCPPTLAALRERAKESLPAFAAPRRLVLLDRVPRTRSGKVRRAHLGPGR